MNLLQTRYEIAVWLKKVTEYFDSGTMRFLAISKAFLPQSRPNSPDRAPHPGPLPAKGGARERAGVLHRHAKLSHTLSPLFRGEGSKFARRGSFVWGAWHVLAANA